MKKNIIKSPDSVINGIKSGILRKNTEDDVVISLLFVGPTCQHEFMKEEFVEAKPDEILEMFPEDEDLSYQILEDGEETSSRGWIRKFQEVQEPVIPPAQPALDIRALSDMLSQQRQQSEATMQTLLKGIGNNANQNTAAPEMIQKMLSDKDSAISKLEKKADKMELQLRETERYYNELVTKLREELQLAKMQSIVNENAKSNLEKTEDLNRQLRMSLDESQTKLKEYELQMKYRKGNDAPDPITASLVEKGIAVVDRWMDSMPVSAGTAPAAEISLMKKPKG